MKSRIWSLIVCGVMAGLLVPLAAPAQTPKAGGILIATLNEAPPSFSLHDETTIGAVWPAMPCSRTSCSSTR